jgi:hypothetical protein
VKYNTDNSKGDESSNTAWAWDMQKQPREQMYGYNDRTYNFVWKRKGDTLKFGHSQDEFAHSYLEELGHGVGGQRYIIRGKNEYDEPVQVSLIGIVGKTFVQYIGLKQNDKGKETTKEEDIYRLAGSEQFNEYLYDEGITIGGELPFFGIKEVVTVMSKYNKTGNIQFDKQIDARNPIDVAIERINKHYNDERLLY